MNIHPIFVHFPIALLTFYSLAELLRFRRLLQSSAWFSIKAFLLIAGTLAALATLQTGDMAEQLLGRSPLIEMHSLWAGITTGIFGFLAVVYLLIIVRRAGGSWMNLRLGPTSTLNKIFNWLAQTAEALQRSLLIAVIALAGLITVTITGGLGGAIVYGPDGDFAIQTIYSLFF